MTSDRNNILKLFGLALVLHLALDLVNGNCGAWSSCNGGFKTRICIRNHTQRDSCTENQLEVLVYCSK